jgi:hypothetical protein
MGPVVRPAPPFQRTSVIREFASRQDVLLVDEHLFDELERPEFFADAVHMNGPASDRFSTMLAEEVRRLLGNR